MSSHADTVSWLSVARRAVVWLVAGVLWVYAGWGLVLGGVLLGLWPALGLSCVAGSVSIFVATYLVRRRRHGVAGALLIAGGVLVGGTLGVFGETMEHLFSEEPPGSLVVAFALGALWGGWPSILAGVCILGKGALTRLPASREPRLV